MELIFATHNQHKTEEVREIAASAFQIKNLKDIGCFEEIPETADTLQGNALQKARYVHEHYHVDCFADDTGLEVEALDGRPGVYSARYSGGDDDDNNEFLLKNLEGVPFEKRTARYVCVICCAYPDGKYFTVRGECEGRIGFEYRGENGFGYDPLFYFESGKTFAEISGEEKDRLSHRGKALRLLAERLSERQ